MPPEEDRVTATGDLQKQFREDRSSGSWDILADRHTDRQTDCTTPLPYRGGGSNVSNTDTIILLLLLLLLFQMYWLEQHYQKNIIETFYTEW